MFSATNATAGRLGKGERASTPQWPTGKQQCTKYAGEEPNAPGRSVCGFGLDAALDARERVTGDERHRAGHRPRRNRFNPCNQSFLPSSAIRKFGRSDT